MTNNEKILIVLGILGLTATFIVGASHVFQQLPQAIQSFSSETFASFESAILNAMYGGREIQSASYSL
ncbi:MAG: hypothetical protein NXI13_01515 [Proteobacteria bacterium]|nr:hypothetical protein [Pseudomonadota bacterium]